ncbi:magnesium/cobalt transporter CorA [Corynebacterium lizhenjunii]|uniref:Magnesium transport protein CorA n=1 Tax=Corynebacterium lizhenjunii TaxID=2709394 RepID=A0A7T0KGJ5_9CORY|nr:magnesium/cobalt transporter CorA [Corynebacterium lizhenjunii]QPK80315.1 magnesium/cobalt transporter CorA [Corynebacterium lizhenjunii]
MAGVPSPFKSRKPKAPSPLPSRVRVPVERAIEHCRVFVDGVALPGEYTPAAAQQALREYGRGFVWVGLHEPDEHQMTTVAEEFRIHELIVEDAVQAHQRPKLERYDDQLFVVARSVNYRDHDEVDDKRQIISTGEVQMIVGGDFLITVRHRAKLPNLAYTIGEDQELVELGPVAMAWKVLDMLVDRYGEIAKLLAIEVDDLEEMIFTPDSQFDIDRIYMFKREVLEMKHAIAPLSDALSAMINNHKDLISKQIRSYLRDVNDHELVVKDQVKHFDERLTSLIDASVAKVSLQQNKDMRTISAVVGMWAAPTLVAGIYGMNFDIMPELHWAFGYPFAILIMVAVVGGLWLWFRKNHWL